MKYIDDVTNKETFDIIKPFLGQPEDNGITTYLATCIYKNHKYYCYWEQNISPNIEVNCYTWSFDKVSCIDREEV